LQPVDRERIIPWVYDASIHAIALVDLPRAAIVKQVGCIISACWQRLAFDAEVSVGSTIALPIALHYPPRPERH
jgi:hypothetical protein